MTNDGFSRSEMKKQVAKGNLEVEANTSETNSKIDEIIDYQYKLNLTQCIVSILLIIVGCILNFVPKNGIAIRIGSLEKDGVVVSNITFNLGALLILSGFYILFIIVKNSNTKYKEKKSTKRN